MTTHLKDERLLAYLDGELTTAGRAEVARHLQECARCAAELEELQGAARLLAAGLARLDRSPPWREMPARLRRALEDGREDDAVEIPFPAAESGGSARSAGGTTSAGRNRGPSRRALAAAAAFILLAGGAAAAIPGSPIRVWVERSVEAVAEALSRPAAPEGVLEPAEPAGAVPGVAVEPANGQIHVAIFRPAAGVVVRVRVVEASRASVSTPGARFRTARGRIEVLEPTAGELLVELPRSARRGVVEVDGRAVLEKRGPDLHFLDPAADTSGSEVRFELGGGDPEGS